MITATLVAFGASLVWIGRMLKSYEDKATGWSEDLINKYNNNKGASND